MSKHTKFCKWRVIFETWNNLKNYLRFKYLVSDTFRSNCIYKFSFGNCAASVLPLWSETPVKGTLPTFVRDHMLICQRKTVHQEI